MHMDQNNIVAIDPSLYSPENRLGNKNIEFMEAWGNFKRKFLKLDVGVPAHISHKLLYLARHGEGEHNAAEADIGEKDWEVSFRDPYVREHG